ncbi:MAG: metallophosphoesterase [Planctomycetes bacterium]|nr:metallophosphoesterase [Planctomycetota bacterium]
MRRHIAIVFCLSAAFGPAHALAAFVPGCWTIAVIPDTQNYTDSPDASVRAIPARMVDWILANKDSRNIRFVVGEGDLVDNNVPEEWDLMKASISPLNGVIPYVMATGNHDYGPGGDSSDRTTYYNDYFAASDNPLCDPALGGTIQGAYEADKVENVYHRFTAPDGREMAVISLEWGPRNGPVAWADGVAGGFTDETAILLTHAYLYCDGTRYYWPSGQLFHPYRYGIADDPDGSVRARAGCDVAAGCGLGGIESTPQAVSKFAAAWPFGLV